MNTDPPQAAEPCPEQPFRRHQLTSRGIKPIDIHQHRFENTWAFGAVEPTSGASHFMEFPTLNGAMMQRFVDDFARAYPASCNLVLVDNASSHRAKTLVLPSNEVLVFQPWEPFG